MQEWNQLGAALRKCHGNSLQIATCGLAPKAYLTEEQQDHADQPSDVWAAAILWKDEHDGGIRGRFWISSEAQTNYGSTSEGKQDCDERSAALLRTMCHTFFEPYLQRHAGKSIFFNGTNQRWTPVLSQLGQKEYDGVCTKAARRIGLQEGRKVECPSGYRLRSLEEKDIDTVGVLLGTQYRPVSNVICGSASGDRVEQN